MGIIDRCMERYGWPAGSTIFYEGFTNEDLEVQFFRDKDLVSQSATNNSDYFIVSKLKKKKKNKTDGIRFPLFFNQSDIYEMKTITFRFISKEEVALFKPNNGFPKLSLHCREEK